MAVSIRLRRMGRKKQPHYRVVVAESEHPRDGRFVESVGYYKPLSRPARLVLDLERVDYWIGMGAQPSGTVKSLIGKARRGGDASVALGEVDVAAEKAKRAERLAERRAAEKRKTEAAPTAVPKDVSDSPGGSSAADATAAEAMAIGEAEAVAQAEDSEPNAPPEPSIARASAAERKGKRAQSGAAEVKPGDAHPASEPKSGASGREDGGGEG
jgi:small subunit ribosomal protein S16